MQVVAGLFVCGGGTLSQPMERGGVAWRVQNGPGAKGAGRRVRGSLRARSIFSGADNAALCDVKWCRGGCPWEGPTAAH